MLDRNKVADSWSDWVILWNRKPRLICSATGNRRECSVLISIAALFCLRQPQHAARGGETDRWDSQRNTKVEGDDSLLLNNYLSMQSCSCSEMHSVQICLVMIYTNSACNCAMCLSRQPHWDSHYNHQNCDHYWQKVRERTHTHTHTENVCSALYSDGFHAR